MFLFLELARRTRMADLEGDRAKGLLRAMGCPECRFKAGTRDGKTVCEHEAGWRPSFDGLCCANQRSTMTAGKL